MLVAYILLSTGKIKNGYLYQTLNLIAAAFMAIGLFSKKAWFTFTLEIFWCFISIYSILKMKGKKD